MGVGIDATGNHVLTGGLDHDVDGVGQIHTEQRAAGQ